MDMLFGVVSIMWVIVVLTLQRLDGIRRDYEMTVRVQFSMDVVGGTGIQLVQLQALQHFSLPALLTYIEHSKKGPRKAAADAATKFFTWHKRLQFYYEIFAVVLTLGLLVAYMVDFSSWTLVQWLDKKWALYSTFAVFCMISLLLPRITDWLGDKYKMIK